MKPDMYWRSEAGGLCTHISDAWCRFVGRDAKDELGHGWAEHLHPRDRARVFAEVAHAYRLQSRFLVCYRLRRYDKQWIDMRSHGVPWIDPVTREFRGYWGSVAPAPSVPAVIARGTGASVVSIRERLVIAPALLTPSVSDTSVEFRS